MWEIFSDWIVDRIVHKIVRECVSHSRREKNVIITTVCRRHFILRRLIRLVLSVKLLSHSIQFYDDNAFMPIDFIVHQHIASHFINENICFSLWRMRERANSQHSETHSSNFLLQTWLSSFLLLMWIVFAKNNYWPIYEVMNPEISLFQHI